MTTYLDSCVYQHLKNEESSDLLKLIMTDKFKNIYCFSEAHLYDLTRDTSDEKFKDMKFIEEIADNNCYYYNKKICFEYCTPTEYYNSFEWPDLTSFNSENSLFSSYEGIFKLIPLKFSDFILPEQIPTDCPLDFSELLRKTTNFHDFLFGFLNFTENLTNEQKNFKELIKYLHNNSLIANVYESIGIKGFDGDKVTDMEGFRESYLAYYLKNDKEKNRYNLFMDMYYGLEIFGFVKGKPKKQKMMNLINDSRHAFLGGFCDILVSKDEDFLNKARFMFDLHDVQTLIFNINEFHEYLANTTFEHLTFLGLIAELNEMESTEVENEWQEEGKHCVAKNLKNTYYSYFDTVTFVTQDNFRHLYFSKRANNFSNGVLTKQIEYVTNTLISELGPDLNQNNYFDLSEIKEGNWCGRTWIIDETYIDLNFTSNMYLRFYPSACLSVPQDT